MWRASIKIVLATGPDDQPACLQRDPVSLASFGAREDATFVAGQLVTASPRHSAGSKRPEHPAVSCREDRRHYLPAHPTWLRLIFRFFPKINQVIKRFYRSAGHQEGHDNESAEKSSRSALRLSQMRIGADVRVETCSLVNFILFLFLLKSYFLSETSRI